MNQQADTSKWQSTVMSNLGMVATYPTEAKSDKRFILSKSQTSSGTDRGDLFTYDPTAAANRWDYVFSFGKFMKFDWLYADKANGWITYRLDSVKVQWYLTFNPESTNSEVSGIYENIYTTPFTNYNFTTRALNQLNTDGTITQTVNSISASTGFTRSTPFRPVLNTIKNAKYISDAGYDYWVASNSDE